MTLSLACARQEFFVFSLHSFTHCAQSADVEFVWGEGFWFLPSPSAVSVQYFRAFENNPAESRPFVRIDGGQGREAEGEGEMQKSSHQTY